MSRAQKEQVEARVSELLRIILDGAETWDLREYVREKEREAGSCWHVPEGGKPLSYSQIRRYAARAEKEIGESSRASRGKLIRRHLAKRRNLFAKAVSAGDYRTALAAARDEAELLGLYPGKRVELSGKDGGPIETLELSQHDRDIAIAAIFTRLGRGDYRPAVDREIDAAGFALGAAGEAADDGFDDTGPLAEPATPLGL